MDIHFYNISDSNNTLNKTLGSKNTTSILLKSSVDVQRPMLILRDNEAFKFDDMNYVEIPELNRFYFIESIYKRSNDLVELQLAVDVLESFKSIIFGSNMRYRRNIEVGDYGSVSIETEGRETKLTYDSDTKFPEGNSLVLTTVGD